VQSFHALNAALAQRAAGAPAPPGSVE